MHRQRDVALRSIAAEALAEFDHQTQRLLGEAASFRASVPVNMVPTPARLP
jgi:hypothetical protein